MQTICLKKLTPQPNIAFGRGVGYSNKPIVDGNSSSWFYWGLIGGG